MLVRDAARSDAASLCAFAVALFEERLPVLYTRNAPPTVDQQIAFIDEMATPRSKLFVAMSPDARVIGMLDFHGEQRAEAAHGGQLGMSVAHGFRGCGVGRRLLEALFAWAPDAGISRIELQVFATNAIAVGLYEGCGFEHEGRRRKAVRTVLGDVDVLLMGKLFD